MALVARSLREQIDCDIQIIIPSVVKFDTSRFEDEFVLHRPRIERKDLRFPAPAFADALDEIFAKLQPDLVVHDCCPARWLATARFPDCPRAIVTNSFVTRLAAADTIQVRLLRKRARRIRRERAARGLADLNSAFDLFEADRVLLADPPWLVPDVDAMPAHYHACGAVWWEAEGDLPQELSDISEVLLCSMGSTGKFVDPRFSTLTADRFGCDDIVRVHAGTKEHRVHTTRGHRMFEWGVLPLGRLLPRVRAVVTSGGAGSTYQALAAGKPMVVVPSHRNHRILGELLETRGVAVVVDSKRALKRIPAERIAELGATAARAGPAHVANDGAQKIAMHLVELISS